MTELQLPNEGLHADSHGEIESWSYYIRISNISPDDITYTVLSREWEYVDDKDVVTQVIVHKGTEAAKGVVGQTPAIKQGHSWEYVSFVRLPERDGISRKKWRGRFQVKNSKTNEVLDVDIGPLPLI